MIAEMSGVRRALKLILKSSVWEVVASNLKNPRKQPP